ncbi:bahcc1 partial [Plasmopara halstedii]|uniref:Bahcc1 partial n=1 Tax=Plasmopara halstedii TaxID=4781 RepID=A0A0P1B0K2_PLAHL|nr:bahcc1 partial [Plasmopara halstedii]CEG46829.1 bahcc1 partial [Plasmopara halstedii]
MATGSKEHADDRPMEMLQPTFAREKLTRVKSEGATGIKDKTSPARITRASSRQSAASDSESDGPRTRGASKTKSSPLLDATSNKGKIRNVKGKLKEIKKDIESDESETSADYVYVQVGDCVLLDSGDPDDPYVALVSSVQTSQRHDRAVSSFVAQWYYKPYDVKEEVQAFIQGGVLENEVFLSPHKDRNSIDAVIEVCQVVSPEEYKEIQDEIRRGYREKNKSYFVCRYKYFPNRSNIKKALESVENEAIRSGLGRRKPNVGMSYQAAIPDFIEPVLEGSRLSDPVVPWKTCDECVVRPRQMWSPLVATTHRQTFFCFRDLIDSLKYAVGNIVKTYRLDAKPMGHQRGIILQYFLSDSIRICVSTGQVLTVLKSEISSPLTDDLAMQQLYLSRFNLSQAAYGCSKTILYAQRKERKAFQKEVEFNAKAMIAIGSKIDAEDSRKRKK